MAGTLDGDVSGTLDKCQAGAQNWQEPVLLIGDLPVTGNEDGDVRLVMSTDVMYAWDVGTSTWIQITTGGTPGDMTKAVYDPAVKASQVTVDAEFTTHASRHEGGVDPVSPAGIGAEPAFAKNTGFNKNLGDIASTVLEGNNPRVPAGSAGGANGAVVLTAALTQGSIPFAGSGGLITQDNSKLFWDNTNNRLGIGSQNPKSALHVKGIPQGTVGDYPAGQLIIQNPSILVNGNVAITGYTSDIAGEPVYQLWYFGSSSSSNQDVIILNRKNANLHFGTNGSTKMTIAADGNVGIGTTLPDNALHVYSDSANVIKAERSSSTTDSSLRVLELHRRTTGTAVNGIGAELAFRVEDGGGGLETVATIQGVLTDVSAESEEGALVFEVVSDSSLVEGMRLQAQSGGIVNAGIEAGGLKAKTGFAIELWDVAGGHFETATTGVEYYSPNQHGGIYGTIYRQYFTTSLPSSLTSGSNVTGLIDSCVQFTYGTDPRGVAHGNAAQYGTGDNRMYIQLTGASGAGNLQVSSNSYTMVSGWVDYTK